MPKVQIQIQLFLKEQSDQGLHCHFIQYFKETLHEKQNLGLKSIE